MTPVELSQHVQDPFRESSEWRLASELAAQLHRHLNTDAALRRIEEVNRPGRSSAAVQETFLEFARDLGFESERKGLFAADELALRPDYYLKLNTSGVILEVERGKTTINNMDGVS